MQKIIEEYYSDGGFCLLSSCFVGITPASKKALVTESKPFSAARYKAPAPDLSKMPSLAFALKSGKACTQIHDWSMLAARLMFSIITLLLARCIEQSHGDVVVGGKVQGCLPTSASCMAGKGLILTWEFLLIDSFVSSNLPKGMLKSSDMKLHSCMALEEDEIQQYTCYDTACVS